MSPAEREIAEIEASYRSYIQAYPQQLLQTGQPVDFDALGFWAFPLLSISCARESISMIDRDAFERVLQTAYASFRDDGWAGRVELDSLVVHGLRPGFGVIEGKGTRYRSDGSALNTWDTMYALRKRNGVWQAYMISDGIQSRPATEQWRAWALSVFGGAAFS